jgi:hypothetical protein
LAVVVAKMRLKPVNNFVNVFLRENGGNLRLASGACANLLAFFWGRNEREKG